VVIGKPKLTEIKLNHAREALPVRIVGDGAISTSGVGDGRMLPVLILDTAQRPDIREYAALHKISGPGDVQVQWGQMPEYADTMMLILAFKRPVEMKAIIAFDLQRNHGFLVEQILGMNGVYIQAGAEGDRLKNTMDTPRVIVEIPDTGFRVIWDKLYLKFTERKFREMGLTRKDARNAAGEAIAKLREFGSFRMPNI
jgi:hypothetical protein